MTRFLTLIAALTATPAMAASGPFWSLFNTNFVVLISFILFILVLLFFKVPSMLTTQLDARADTIRGELEEARKLREEAQELRASFERKKAEVQEQAERIVEKAKADAQLAAEQAKVDLETSIARRMRAAEDQIASAEAGAVREVRDQAIEVAVEAARGLIGENLAKADANALIDASIDSVGSRLH